jgi:molybdopterin biosynthesis enzyme
MSPWKAAMNEPTTIVEEIAAELISAQRKFPPFHNAHEGYAVLLEEVDELWKEVKVGSRVAMRREAIQVAAMALRFLVDVVPRRSPRA